jgi:hypothetical protein
MILDYSEWRRLNERAAEPKVVPSTPTKPSTPVAPPRPARPGPRIRPDEGERERPLAKAKEVLDLFFSELKKEKDSERGREMIKKLHSKYAKH